MDVLVIGSGGREHALAWKLSGSPRCGRLFCAPGNAGTGEVGTNVAIGADDRDGLFEFARAEGIGLTVVGPDDTLAAGLVDVFEAGGLRILGPRREAARIESSKVFAKEFMGRHGIPTARHAWYGRTADAVAGLGAFRLPVVIKADGLALGKGVVIARTEGEAVGAIRAMLDEGRFGEAGRRILIEEFLEGEECSIHALFDADTYLVFPPARDHKQVFDGDAGPNTGGMGTFSPPGAVDDAMMGRIVRDILDPFQRGIRAEGLGFRGMLFPGLMLTDEGPKVLEFNARFGDPETQVLLPRLRSDLLDLLLAAADDRLAGVEADWDPRTAVCVVMASGGYPGPYRKGLPIAGLGGAASRPDIHVFHAGTASGGGDSPPVTAGGRVLGVTALGDTLDAARAAAYAAVGGIHFEGAHYRRDIGLRGRAAPASRD